MLSGNARKLLAYLAAKNLTRFHTRDLRAGPRTLRKAADLKPVITELVGTGRVRAGTSGWELVGDTDGDTAAAPGVPAGQQSDTTVTQLRAMGHRLAATAKPPPPPKRPCCGKPAPAANPPTGKKRQTTDLGYYGRTRGTNLGCRR